MKKVACPLLQRNDCVIWHRNPHDGSIFTCLKEGEDFIILRGIQSWLWLKLSRPSSIIELKELVKSDANYSQFYNELEEIIKSLIEKKVLKDIDAQQNRARPDVPQKYKAIYMNLWGELKSAKNFTKSEDLNIYHKNSIHTTDKHFETKEVTVSHMYREPHPALGGLSYGAKLYRKLNSIKKITPHSLIVEVGAGLGFLARSFLDEHKKYNEDKEGLEYTFCDLTFEFLKSQRYINKHHRIQYCQANAEKIPFKDNSIDIIIANENIADFTAIKLDKKMILDYLDNKIDLHTIKNDLIRKSLEWIKSCSIDVRDDAMPEFIFNIGAIEFIKEVARVLSKGGLAFITEYGSMEDYPTAVRLAGHVEYSIQFSHLIKVIEALGLKVKLCTLLDFLEFDKDMEVIDYCSLRFLYSLLKQKNIELPFLAYTREMLENKIPKLIDDCNNLKFYKIAKMFVAYPLNKFYALLIFKDHNHIERLNKNT